MISRSTSSCDVKVDVVPSLTTSTTVSAILSLGFKTCWIFLHCLTHASRAMSSWIPFAAMESPRSSPACCRRRRCWTRNFGALSLNRWYSLSQAIRLRHTCDLVIETGSKIPQALAFFRKFRRPSLVRLLLSCHLRTVAKYKFAFPT